MIKKKKIICIVALSIIMFFGFVNFPVVTQANESTNKEEITINDIDLEPGQVDMDKLPVELKKKLEKRIEVINNYFEDLSQAEARYESLLEKSENNYLTTSDKTELLNAKKQYDYLYDNPESIVGLSMVKNDNEDSKINPQATIQDVTVNKPTLYYDNDSKMYVMNGGWKWNKTNPDINPGGDDGFGLKTVQRKISVFDSGLTTYTTGESRSTHSISRDVGSYGIGLRFQDRSNGITYTGHKGNGWMYFKWYSGTPTGYAVNYRTVYAHSWNTTALNGFSIGADSFGLSWSSSSNKFSVENYSVVQY